MKLNVIAKKKKMIIIKNFNFSGKNGKKPSADFREQLPGLPSSYAPGDYGDNFCFELTGLTPLSP